MTEKEEITIKEKGVFVGFLFPQYDARKSFYKKAKILSYDGNLYLQSYNTIVAKNEGGKIDVFGWYSQTTARHINEFLKQNGCDTMTKKEMEA